MGIGSTFAVVLLTTTLVVPDVLPARPSRLNIGSGKDFREDCLNVDVNPDWHPDIAVDMSADVVGCTYGTARFGDIRLDPESFELVYALDVLEHVPRLLPLMSNVLMLLKVGGVWRINVPYDLSLGAWQDPTHVRAFNENSWLYYTDWWWYSFDPELGARFELVELICHLNDYGRSLPNLPMDEVLRVPRAVDSMTALLEKRLLTPSERVEGLARRGRQRS